MSRLSTKQRRAAVRRHNWSLLWAFLNGLIVMRFHADGRLVGYFHPDGRRYA